MSKRVLITSALPYANGPLHFGHIAGAYLPGDCYARYCRLKGSDVLYLCGSDEYGVAITMSAEKAGRSYREHVDHFHKINRELFSKLDFAFDHFSRTTNPYHAETAQEFFLELYNGGYIEERTENHLFSEQEQKFLADRYVVGICPRCGYDKARGDECGSCGASYEALDLKKPRSKQSGAPLILKPSKHWYMRFDKFKDRLSDWLSKKDWKANVLKFTQHYIDDLKPRAITRDATWGVPVPLAGTEGKVLYVWFDAPIGYISAAKEWAAKIGDKERWKDYWLSPDTELVEFIGKDNIPFHTVFFPAMIMGQKKPYKLPDNVPANEFLLLEGKQFSKSDNWYIDLEDFFKKFKSDQIRFYLASNAPENSDADFKWKDFQTACNAMLLGKLGNFVHRTMVFAQNNCDGVVPPMHELDRMDKDFLKEATMLVNQIDLAYSHFQLRKAAASIMELAQLGNTYFDFKKPWQLVKLPESVPAMNTTIALCLLCIRKLALVCQPIMPHVSQQIWALLGNTDALIAHHWDELQREPVQAGQKLAAPYPLFKRVEDADIEQKEIAMEKTKPIIEYADFEKLDLQVGTIAVAEKVAKSSKLLRLEVDLGAMRRQIISGIAQKFSPEELIGKKVLVLVNLKPIKMMGLESCGMILAAGSSIEDLELPFFDQSAPGAPIS